MWEIVHSRLIDRNKSREVPKRTLIIKNVWNCEVGALLSAAILIPWLQDGGGKTCKHLWAAILAHSLQNGGAFTVHHLETSNSS